MRRLLSVLITVLAIGVAAIPLTAFAASQSGAISFGQASVEPAYDGTTGQEVFILLPDHAKLQPTAAWSPLYLVMYPTSSTIGTLDCTPDNCDHANVVPSGLGDTTVYPNGSISTHFGDFTGGIVKGHDHLLGTDAKGHMHVTKHVYFALFTAKAVADGVTNQEITTIDQLNQDIANGYVAEPVDTGLMVHASIVSATTYLRNK
jgi:hypothetical protein